MKQKLLESQICVGNLSKKIMKTFRLIRSKPNSATYNMALDEKIFLRFIEDGIPVLRIYSWEAPSITIGISQEAEGEIDLKQCQADGASSARRFAFSF